MKIMTRRNS